MDNTFKLNESFKEKVRNRDNDSIFSSFAVLINTDRSFEKGKGDAAIKYIKERYPEFIKPDVGEKFKDESEWTEDYWTKVSVSMDTYFSLEKFEFLRKMSKKLYPPKKKQYEFEEENNSNWDDSPKKPNTALAIAIVAGAVITAAGIIIAIINK